ncbi:tetratricopeptide repeat protein 5 isoform X1 [Amborella trichopoda]|uniref:tetratricopeptide repeat protein 5 isoform X1 n=1 Tax=Amborella trichopoda TaxID=13333 RepID=UPI0009BED981|nr:tetratricopeptide repeat protein 5 isoform X1 [Amborella trichopoda]|eukprot:XP_020522845.1 tetratricopeptide repeat protein 5 isoform X1 [Amborella trichopoda]
MATDPGSMAPDVDKSDPMVTKLLESVDNLYLTRDKFFPVDPMERSERLQREVDEVLKLLSSTLPPEKRVSSLERATYEYLRGKILDVFPEHCKEAEDHLSKAIKLNPFIQDAWLCLGNCLWKKGELAAAKNCLLLALNKGREKRILCLLSMLERKIAEGTENPLELVEESIGHAKEAVMLDIKDGSSWHTLGNSYFVSFFVGGTQDEEKLKHALKAYANAVSLHKFWPWSYKEKDESMKTNSDLHFNKAILDQFMEKYDAALSGFEAAALQNPSLNADKNIEKIIKVLDKLNDSVTNQGHLKPHRIASMVEALRKTTVNIPYTMATLNLLRDGKNNGMAVLGKVMVFIRLPFTSLPYFLLCDSDGTFFILSLYALSSNGVKNGDTVTLLNPNCRVIDFSWKGKEYRFKSIRVDRLGNILVNGSPPHSDHVRPMAIHTKHIA